MNASLLLRILWIWCGFFLLAFVNGAFREFAIKPILGEPWSQRFSAFTAFLLFGFYISVIWKKTLIVTYTQAFLTGIIWFVLTFLTETFIIGRWWAKLDWEQITQHYNVLKGELWFFVLIWIGVLPIIARALEGPAE